ncbi:MULTISPECIES: putative bifunctional diguanylate cyclase/phosphodiesterase [Sphingobium]|uniref:putative bifunctional diguanylate cyclase/phosphodiesterase n=1 Tax=Sphingobium TaxID=165695 RepID=UPI0015EC4E47|nr:MULTISPECIES: EAL domain-containing protein [Sphingobium]MCW2361983.1 diguanylate cyclase (GGDEF)-like protein/PAS domain S-box-containing protein [Sphingobium sp. B10D3B]MCW2401338.1 diguanylate cyclase (GGDEF)-like protein/PAS domain S-box-containing protein [Sphingobium sp. B10D7B]MCW2408318.1 diguanylate cyclase (GGDEF)-like protein/PAS domain S-box-containing protein [Sphingobium xanthum]
MTKRSTVPDQRAAPATEVVSLGLLCGFRPLPGAQGRLVCGSQLRSADRMLGLFTTITAISAMLVGARFYNHINIWMFVVWMLVLGISQAQLLRLRRVNVASDYADATRAALLRHGAICWLQGAIWVAAMVLFTGEARPEEVVTFWTIACCLMASVAISFQSTPLSASGFILSIGTGTVWMMLRHADPFLAGVVAIYALLALATSLWQAHQFGVQVSTSKALAEKREVVSLLLREHDRDGADVLWQTDTARRLTGVSPAFARMLGKTVEEVDGQSILQVLAGSTWTNGDFDPALHVLAEKLKDRVSFSDLCLSGTVDGARRWWSLSASPRLDQAGNFLGFRGVGSDITVQKETNERISQLARLDTLTNLPNRLNLGEELAKSVEDTQTWQTRCAFMMIDLDRFKSVNDTLGHHVGDQLLAQVAERLRGVCSLNEVCGRLGGDEFAVVVREVADPIYVDRLASAIIEVVSRPYVLDGQTLFIGASIGSAMAPQDGTDADMLMRSADLAMYRAKEAGRGKHLRFTASMHADAEERRNLELALRNAIEAGEFHLVYQPILNARSRHVIGFEALCRWTHPQLGPIPPSRFIPIAEDTRLISRLGAWVLETACKTACHWPDAVSLSVNVSAQQLCDPEIVPQISAALAQSGLPASRLELEVTESVFMQEETGASQALDRLAKMGIRLSLDDFGTGYSSLGYLSRARFDTIKVDQSFIHGAARGQRESLAIINAVVAMATSLGLETTAEGVETEGEYDIIRALGCSKIQGYYFGRPMSRDESIGLFGRSATQVA